MTSRHRTLVAAAFFLTPLALACAPAEPDRRTGGKGGSDQAGGEGGGDMGGSGGGGRGGTGGSNRVDARPPDGPSPDTAGAETAPPDDCATSRTSLLCDPLGKMPKTIKETGLFPSAPDFTKRSPRLHHYVPDPPLWSDGLEKERYLLLPAGKKIDNSKAGPWVFPVGTVFIKTFLDDSGAGGKPRAIETRFIRRVGDEMAFTEYDYYLYQWNADGTDATLVIDDRVDEERPAPTVKVTVNHTPAGGTPLVINKGLPFDHTLPSRTMCGDCHQENGVAFQTFIGFDELRLNSKRTPSAVKTQLQEFQEADLFTTRPKAGDPAPRTITDADPVALKAKRFIFGNCVHCHHEKGKVFDLSPDNLVKNTVNQMTEAQSVHPPAGWLRVVPGMPEMSVVYVQARRTPLPMPTMNGQNRLRPMPPIGVADVAADPDGVAALRAWIMGLKK